MIILGIESSCDETGVALFDHEYGELAHRLYSQIELHRQHGGVVPELAARDHINRIIPLIKQTLNDAHLKLTSINAIAYTAGPGLLGALLCGASIAQSLALSLNIPSIGIHHMEGHLLAALLNKHNSPGFPFIGLLVSGGHTQLIHAKAIGDYDILGTTLDDAVGEAFDKTAKLMGLPYPGGPELAELADSGNPNAIKLTRPLINRPGMDFSFSGLKTQVRLLIEAKNRYHHADIAAAFQQTIIDTLLIKCRRAIAETHAKSLVISGGVGANQALRSAFQAFCQNAHISLHIPPHHLCTDNGLMIAHAGALRIKQADKDYRINCKARWSLADLKPIT